VQKSTYPAYPSSPLPHPNQTDSLAAVMPWLLLLFAYGWWAIIIVYYGLLETSISLGYQFQSFPIVVVSLALVHILKLSLQKQNYLLSALVGMGLFVSGLLA
jgi:hypothetical protein